MKTAALRYTASTALTLFSATSLSAPLFDIDIVTSHWQAEYSGKIGQNNDTATLDQLGFDDEDHSTISATLKHPIPALPNIQLQHTDLKTDANGTLAATLVIDGTTYNASENVVSDLDLSHTDITLFYSPFNNWVQLNLGLTARHFNGEAVITSTTTNTTESLDLDEWLPLIYAGAQLELPLTGWYLGADINGLSYDDSSLVDYSTALGYSSDGLVADVAIELGYRAFALKTDNINGFEGNVDIDGVFLSLGVKL